MARKKEREVRPESHFYCDGDNGKEYLILVHREFERQTLGDGSWSNWYPAGRILKLDDGRRVMASGDGTLHIKGQMSPVLTKRPDSSPQSENGAPED